jgi:hypothetical protein
MDYEDDLNYNKEELLEVDKMFNRLKKRKPKNLDDVIHDAHDEVFERIDCLSCGNCCKTTSPIFRDIDIQRIAKKFKEPAASIESKYLKKDSDDDWVLKSSPCTFLGEDNSCFIYDVRPQACREYPHTNRKKMHQILDVTRKNIEVCPAVSAIVREITKVYT